MGSEDLFKKRKAAQASQLKRKEITKPRKETVLIVCEGAKTEPAYLNALLRHFGLQNRVRLGEIVVDHRRTGLDPSKLVEHAEQLFFDKRNEGITYDRVYCVFDKDCHARYIAACERIGRQPLREKRSGKAPLAEMTAITSVPCFEVWLLLHFTNSAAPFHGSEKYTPCEQVIAKLKTFRNFGSYRKSDATAFENTKDKLDAALINAERIWKQKENNGDNPSIRVFELVAYLKKQATE
jgi:hypothetical protein